MSQMQNSQIREEKIQQVAERLSKSEAFRKTMDFTALQWIGILAELDDEKIDGFTLILDEEDSGLEGIEKERERKHVNNQARYLQRLEKLKISAELLDDNLPKQ